MKPARWLQIEHLYNQALEMEESRRAAFLREACSGDEELRQDVEELLSESPANFLEEPALREIAHEFAATAAPSWIGRQIGNYQFVSLAGAGGMGEVYRAHDTKLKREVAIKILPEEFSRDSDRVSRFQREAQLLASLNHPNIAAIYDLEEVNGFRFLILELVEGETLSEWIARSSERKGSPLKLKETLAIAGQIAHALEEAHEKGIVHRDLKPANIKITREGVVKVLDFGLAKSAAGDEANRPDPNRSGEATAVGSTHDGLIMGTAAYMSPEHARGGPVDKRTDIWAFGCVLYEMLSGHAVFARETIADTLAAIVEREPDWTALPSTVPLTVRRLLQRCLDKDPKRRLRDIGDARFEIEQLALAPAEVASAGVRADLKQVERDSSGKVASATPRRELTGRAYGAAGLIGLALLFLAGLFYSTKPSAPVTLPSEYTQITNFTDSAVAPSLSPDGRMVTFIRGGEFFLGPGQIYVKLLPNGEAMRLTNDMGRKYGPVFTPDGSRIAYTNVTNSGDTLLWDTWTVPVLGGQPTRLLPNASGLTWITDQRVLFSEIMAGTSLHMGIVTATEGRAESRELYFPPHESAMAHYSYASPDRKSVLVVEMNQTHMFNQPCRLLPFDGSSAGRQIGPPGTCTSTAWSPDGKWMYFGARVGGSAHLWRQKFPDGTPEQITFGPIEEEGIALAPDGRSLVTSAGNRRSAIWIHDATGERAISSEGFAVAPRLSRDGKRVFYLSVRDFVASSSGWVPSSAELRSVDLGSGNTDTVLPGVSVADYDISRDEKEVAFTTAELGRESKIWLASLDRRKPPRQITAGDQVSFGAEGDLIFRSLEGKTNFPVRIKKDGSGREPLTTVPILEKSGVSPDGEWVIAYSPATALGGMHAVSVHGGATKKICAGYHCRAMWSFDGRFFYVEIDRGTSAASAGKTLAIPVPAGKSFPDLPASGIDLAAGGELAGIQVIAHSSISPGLDPSTYVFTKTDLQRNLFRIPLH